jgi:bile acid-coenzyme A ligase
MTNDGKRRIDAPCAKLPIPAILASHAERIPAATAVTCDGDTLTFSQLYQNAKDLASKLRLQGVQRGDLVANELPNSLAFYLATAAAWLLGATPLPLSPSLVRAEREAIVEIAQPRVVVRLDDIAQLGVPVEASAMDENAVSPSWKAQTSGGSTGRPKVIVSSRPGQFEPTVGESMGISRADACLIPGPLYHSAPFTYSMYGLFGGAHQVVMRRFDARVMLDLLGRHGITWVVIVPTMMTRILRLLQQEPALAGRLSSLRTVWHMGAPCPEWLKRAWIDLVGADNLWELYGSAEGQEVTMINGRDWLNHPGSVGRPRGDGAFRILDANRVEVPPGTVGDIFVRGADVCGTSYHYLGAPEAERVDGWETVGDVGWLDGEGYLYVSDRRADLIISGGVNVYPAEVEAAIDQHPAVMSSVVVGLPDEDLGERVHAVVHASAGLQPEELLMFVRSLLTRAKQPRSVEMTERPLRDDAGKVRRSVARADAIARATAAIRRHEMPPELLAVHGMENQTSDGNR